MAGNVHELRPKAPDSEKITINLGHVDLGQIDLLVQGGFYSNRTDFIRTAIRNQLDRHEDAVKQSVARHRLGLGLHRYVGRTWRRCTPLEKPCTFKFSGWLSSRRTSLPTSPARPLPPSTSLVPSRPVPP